MLVGMRLPADVVELMGRQYGLITRQQCLARGMSASRIDERVRTGLFEVVARGVYRLPGVPVPPEQPHRAATLRARAWLTAEAVLALCGLRGCSLACAPQVVVEAGRCITNVSFTVIARPVDATTMLARIPCVPPIDAFFDLAGDPGNDDRRVRTVADALQWKGVGDLERLRRRARELPEHLGAARFAALDDARAFQVESEGERDLIAFLGPFAAFFRWRVTDVVSGLRLDGFDDESRLNLEYDGEEDHHGAVAREADDARDRRVRAHDIEIIRVRKDDIRGARAAHTLARILACRAERLARRTIVPA